MIALFSTGLSAYRIVITSTRVLIILKANTNYENYFTLFPVCSKHRRWASACATKRIRSPFGDTVRYERSPMSLLTRVRHLIPVVLYEFSVDADEISLVYKQS